MNECDVISHEFNWCRFEPIENLNLSSSKSTNQKTTRVLWMTINQTSIRCCFFSLSLDSSSMPEMFSSRTVNL
ncbi:unnamed protein product [Adineta ricciae]|uniref:Uncharacterized protein n=1 Tax=Adineta ricciae TaxID=249248 RepID=A0A814MSF8_ADIRI|nr:unnamed protein product [Adineta ricciae]